jgi:sugar phosphate isomerase/epimerase
MAAFSYNKLLSGRSPKLKLEDFIHDCAKLDLEGTELTGYYFAQPIAREYLRHLKHLTFRLGLDISATAMGNDFCEPPGEKRTELLQRVKQWIEYAEILGAPALRIHGGRPREGQDPETAHKLVVEAIQECCDYAARHGVFIALENNVGVAAAPDGVLRILREVKSPWFGLTLDPGNLRTADIYADTARLAPYALNVHLKVTCTGPDRQKQPMDFKRIAKILRESGYRGYVALEYEEEEDPREACARYIPQIREAFA